MNKFIAISICLFLLFCILDINVRIIRIKTQSIPYRFCLHLLRVTPKKGDLCVFSIHRNNKDHTLVKYIAGIEGDYADVKDDNIYINEELVGTIKSSEYTAIKSMNIPVGYVFVLGSSDDSFDSRYAEFGLIKTSQIKGKAIGFWRF